MEKGREDYLFNLADRGVRALEKLCEDPVIEMEISPPICPHCQKLNPDVGVIENQQGRVGPLFTFFVVFQCQNCKNNFFAVPMQWSMHEQTTTLMTELQGREGNNEGLSGLSEGTPVGAHEERPIGSGNSFAG